MHAATDLDICLLTGLSTLAQNCCGIKVLHVTHCLKLDRHAYSLVAAALSSTLVRTYLGALCSWSSAGKIMPLKPRAGFLKDPLRISILEKHW